MFSPHSGLICLDVIVIDDVLAAKCVLSLTLTKKIGFWQNITQTMRIYLKRHIAIYRRRRQILGTLFVFRIHTFDLVRWSESA